MDQKTHKAGQMGFCPFSRNSPVQSKNGLQIRNLRAEIHKGYMLIPSEHLEIKFLSDSVIKQNNFKKQRNHLIFFKIIIVMFN